MNKKRFYPFGYEYSFFSKWNRLQKKYISCFGVIDLPTRIRFQIFYTLFKDALFTSVIDAGCANGLYSFYLASLYPESQVFGYDINSTRIEEANRVAAQLGRKNLFFQHLNLSEFDEMDKADLIICIESIQYVPDDMFLIKQFRKALKKEGRLFLHAPALPCLTGNESQDHFYDKQSLTNLLISGGFQIDRIGYTFGWYENFLSDIFSFIIEKHPFLIPVIYPVLLLLIRCCRIFHAKGRYIAAVATRRGD